MTFTDLMTRLTVSVCQGDGAAAASCFTADGMYHDCFYGSFQGREKIADMVESYFHRDGGDFTWDLHDPVSQGDNGYVRYLFSYRSKLDTAGNARSLIEGVCICKLEDGLLANYREVANSCTGLYLTGFSPARMAKFVARETQQLIDRAEARHHLS